jgi:hypothetical protein
MPKEVVVIETPESKCLTKWEAFEEAGLVPAQIRCQDYHPAQQVDQSCHSNCLLEAQSVVGHMNPDHSPGGGFMFVLRRGEKNAKIWKDLKAAGVEMHDFRCEVCDKEVPLVARRILKHLEAHSGKSRSPKVGGMFLATLKFDPPMEGDDEEF